MPSRTLNVKQKRFVQNYATPDSDTYGNGTQSAIKAGYTGNPNSAAVRASTLLSDMNVQTYIDALLAESGADDLIRIGAVASVIKGEYETTTTTETVGTDKNGNPIKSKTKSTRNPTAAEVVKAAQLVERMRGTFDKNKAVSQAVGKSLSKLYSDQRKTIAKESKKKSTRD